MTTQKQNPYEHWLNHNRGLQREAFLAGLENRPIEAVNPRHALYGTVIAYAAVLGVKLVVDMLTHPHTITGFAISGLGGAAIASSPHIAKAFNASINKMTAFKQGHGKACVESDRLGNLQDARAIGDYCRRSQRIQQYDACIINRRGNQLQGQPAEIRTIKQQRKLVGATLGLTRAERRAFTQPALDKVVMARSVAIGHMKADRQRHAKRADLLCKAAGIAEGRGLLKPVEIRSIVEANQLRRPMRWVPTSFFVIDTPQGRVQFRLG